MKNLNNRAQMYHVLVKDNDEAYFVTYDHFNKSYIEKPFDGSYSEKYTLQKAEHARHKFMDNNPHRPEPEILPVD